MDIFAQYATNADAEENGRYFENGDVEFLIARGNNTRFARMLNKQYQGNREILDATEDDTPERQKASDDLGKKITIDVMSKSILLGWRGRDLGEGKVGEVTYQGKPLPYSVENAQLLLGHKDFMAWVNGKANTMSNYLASAMEDDAKNSESTSSGTSPGEVVSES